MPESLSLFNVGIVDCDLLSTSSLALSLIYMALSTSASLTVIF